MSLILVRADGSASVGYGHVMRTLAIAEAAAAQSLSVHYITAGAEVKSLLDRRGFTTTVISEASDTAWCDGLGSEDIVIFDGYTFSAEDYEAAARRGAITVAVDDTGTGEFPVDLIVNPDMADGHNYTTRGHTRIVGGTEYALVRKEFSGRRRERGSGTANLVLTFGGTDAASISARAVGAISTGSGFDGATLVVGPGAPISAGMSDDIKIIRDPADLGAVFDTADAAISAAGVTAWELMCMGVPSALVAVADNQLLTGKIVRAHDAAVFLGPAADFEAGLPAALTELADPERRAELSRNAMALVDGNGAERVLAAILSLSDRARVAPR